MKEKPPADGWLRRRQFDDGSWPDDVLTKCIVTDCRKQNGCASGRTVV